MSGTTGFDTIQIDTEPWLHWLAFKPEPQPADIHWSAHIRNNFTSIPSSPITNITIEPTELPTIPCFQMLHPLAKGIAECGDPTAKRAWKKLPDWVQSEVPQEDRFVEHVEQLLKLVIDQAFAPDSTKILGAYVASVLDWNDQGPLEALQFAYDHAHDVMVEMGHDVPSFRSPEKGLIWIEGRCAGEGDTNESDERESDPTKEGTWTDPMQLTGIGTLIHCEGRREKVEARLSEIGSQLHTISTRNHRVRVDTMKGSYRETFFALIQKSH